MAETCAECGAQVRTAPYEPDPPLWRIAPHYCLRCKRNVALNSHAWKNEDDGTYLCCKCYCLLRDEIHP